MVWEIRGEYLIKSQKTERSKVKQKRKKNQLLLLLLQSSFFRNPDIVFIQQVKASLRKQLFPLLR